jgi:formiminoglutamate deiminase
VTTYWCEHAWLGDRVGDGVAITVEGDRITAVDTDAPRTGVHLAGLTLPGFANAHSHAFHRALRGRTHGETGSFWTWRERMYALAARLDPDSYRRLATAVFAEMVLSGYTAVGEFHYLHHDVDGVPYADSNAMGRALLEAAAVSGIRIKLIDACYLQADLSGAPLQGTQRRFGDGDGDGWVSRVDALHAQRPSGVGAAIHSVRAVGEEAMKTIASWADARGVVVHAHVSEQPAENQQCLAATGCTPMELLERNGALSHRFTAVHATHLTDHDVALLAKSSSTCCMCPTTERDLADGIGPTAAFRHHGIAMAIGSDSHAVIDPLEETRAIELDERLASLQRGTHHAAALLEAATSNGYRSLGWSDGGQLAAGSLADMVTIGLDSPRLAGSDPDHLAAAVVFAATASDVSHVIVGGGVVVSDGAHREVDVGRALSDSINAVWA